MKNHRLIAFASTLALFSAFAYGQPPVTDATPASGAASAATPATPCGGPNAPCQRPGPGAGSGPGMGPGSGPGMAPGKGGRMGGRGYRFGSSNTPGWSMMSPQERGAHRDRMLGMKSYEECETYLDEHHKTMEARAKEKGAKPPLAAPRLDMCERMKQRGFFEQAPKK